MKILTATGTTVTLTAPKEEWREAIAEGVTLADKLADTLFFLSGDVIISIQLVGGHHMYVKPGDKVERLVQANLDYMESTGVKY